MGETRIFRDIIAPLRERRESAQICEILFGGIFTPKSSILPRKMQINAMFFVSVYQGFLGVARKNAGLSSLEDFTVINVFPC